MKISKRFGYFKVFLAVLTVERSRGFYVISQGSIIVHYYTVFNADVPYKDYSKLDTSLYEAYEALLVSMIAGYNVNDTYLNETMPSEIAQSEFHYCVSCYN